MTERIEFDAIVNQKATLWGTGEVVYQLIVDHPAPTPAHSRYRVILTPIEPEPELRPCPRCGGVVRVVGMPLGYRAVCVQCRHEGPLGNSRQWATETHNARTHPQLDPCPFCGGEWECFFRPALGAYFALCQGCAHQTKRYRTKYDLAAAVNRRA